MDVDESSSQIDFNKVVAYALVELCRDSIVAIYEKARARQGGDSAEPVKGIVDIAKSKPWKKLERSLLVVLQVYPGLIDLLKDDDLRSKFLLLDTGAGLLFVDPALQEHLPAARVSPISHVVGEVQAATTALKRSLFLGSCGDSARSLYESLKRDFDPGTRNLVEWRFESLSSAMESERFHQFFALQIPVTEYDARLHQVIRDVAVVCGQCTRLLGDFIIERLGTPVLVNSATRISRTTLTARSSIATFRQIAGRCNLDESSDFDDAAYRLQAVDERVSSARLKLP